MEIVREARKQYKCGVCGNYSHWTENHRYAERLVGSGYNGYEISFVICSKECHDKSKEPFVNWLKKYQGWGKKKASDNWEETIKNNYNNTND